MKNIPIIKSISKFILLLSVFARKIEQQVNVKLVIPKMIAAKKIYLFVLIEKPTKKLSILTAIASTITLIIDKT